MSNGGLLKPAPDEQEHVTEPLFHDAVMAGRKAGDAAVQRLGSISNEDADRVDTDLVDEDDVPFDEPYTCVSHTLRGDDSSIYYSYLLFPTNVRDDIVEDYSLWPGDFDAEYEDEAKIEAVAHNLANSAVDTYVAASTDTEFEVSPPELAEYDAGESPIIDHYDGSGHAAILNRLAAGDVEFRHILVLPPEKLRED